MTYDFAGDGVDALVTALSNLYVAVVADVLDGLGRRGQVMAHTIRPVTTEHLVVGPAYPVRAVPTVVVPENPYEHEIAAVDAVPDGAVIVISAAFDEAAVWGALLATRAHQRGCIGAVSDGAVRDVSALRDMRMPTFASAVNARDSRGRLEIIEHGTPVDCGGVVVSAGDLVMADLDGVVVVPRELAQEVVYGADAKRAVERTAMAELEQGVSASEMYAKFGTL